MLKPQLDEALRQQKQDCNVPSADEQRPHDREELAVDFTAFINEGQQARAEELAERLELAIDALLEFRLQGTQGTIGESRDVLFDLYERGILTRDQVRRRGNLDPSDFYEELHAFRLRQAVR